MHLLDERVDQALQPGAPKRDDATEPGSRARVRAHVLLQRSFVVLERYAAHTGLKNDDFCIDWSAMLSSMSRLPLQTLPAFRAVARTGNLRLAADALFLTHSAVSQQIRLLEQQIGFQLFDRRGRRIVLNAAGEALQRAVEPALDRLDDGLRAAAAAASG